MKTIASTLKMALKNMYDVSDVSAGFEYWFFKFLGFALSIFEYENLPESIPSRELELLLILQGYATPFYDNRGLPVAVPTNIYGYDKYYTPNSGTYGNAIIPTKTLYFQNNAEHTQNAVLMFNSDLHTNIFYLWSDGALLSLIQRYARRMADLEASENIYTVKTRFGNAPVGSTDSVRNSIKNFVDKIRVGKFDTITDDSIINCFRTVDFGNNTNENLMSFAAARDKIIEQFFRDIGVKMSNQKKAQVTSNEIESDEQLLLISIDDMLKTRKQGLDDFNRFFHTNATVRINPKYDRANFSEKVNERGSGTEDKTEIKGGNENE